MNKISYLILLIFVSTIYISTIYAVPATPYPITITQADGSEITIRLHGDEFFNYKTTLDGYALVANTDGILTYAQIDATGNLFSSGVKANNIEKRLNKEILFVKNLSPNLNFTKQNLSSRAMRAPNGNSNSTLQKSYPRTGSPKSLVILVNFSDKSFVIPSPQAAYTNLLNQEGYSANGGTGSARDYFKASTYGKFSPVFDVVGPYTLPQTLDYYGKNDASGNDTNPAQMIVDACAAANTAGLDFTQFDTDGDNYVDNVFVYYAGYNEADGGAANTIWPHRWNISSQGITTGITFDGKKIQDYSCTSELKKSGGMCGVGVFCHEFGHVISLPDYYDTSGKQKNTLNEWDIMDAGSYNNDGRTPPTYSVYDRFFLGYLTPQQIKSPSFVILKPIYQGKTQPINTINQAFLFSATTHNLNGASPSPSEFFMVEYRKKTGWDAYLPSEGMLIWHIDYDNSVWNNNTPNNFTGTSQTAASHMRVYLQPLIGSTTTPGTAFTTGSFTPTTWSGTDIKRPLTYIKKTSDSITFRFMGWGNIPSISTAGQITSFTTVQGTPSITKTITVSGMKLIGNIDISLTTNLHFEIKKESDPETSWAKTMSLTPGSDSIVNNQKILIRYNPTEPSFSNFHTDSLVLKSSKAEIIKLSLSGSSTRKIWVVAPLATDANDLSIASFNANWKPTFDATGYYLTVYNISDGTSELTEGFDNGMKAPIDWTIKVDTISKSNVYFGLKTPSLQFSNTGEYVETEKYILPVTKLSFYIRSVGATNGGFLIKAQNALNNWQKVDSIPVTTTLFEKNKTYTFDESFGYNRFRFTYTKGGESVTLDDITVGFGRLLEYNAREEWISDTTSIITNLVSNRDYYFKVRASDKCLNPDSTIKYENITDFSNMIQVHTLENKSKANALIARVNQNGTVTVIVPSTEMILNIYNILGQHVRSISPNCNKLEIKDLPRNQSYILQAGNLRSKIVL